MVTFVLLSYVYLVVIQIAIAIESGGEKMDKRKNNNLKKYMERGGILPEYIISKKPDGIETPTELRHWYKESASSISLEDIRKICNCVFIYQDKIYVSEDMVIKELFSLSQIKKALITFQKGGKKKDIENFLEKGVFIIDIDDFENNSYVFMDWNNYIIWVANKYKYKEKLLREKPLEAILLDEEEIEIPEELFAKFFPYDFEQNMNENYDYDAEERDEQEIELLEEYEYLYE